MTAQDVINQCYIENGVVKLPQQQLERKLYESVSKILQGIGGKWKGGKIMGFVFESEPNELLQRVQEGESINLKKDFQFFATPDPIADKLVRYLNLKFDHKLLEPSAGNGALVKAVRKVHPLKQIDCCELFPQHYDILSAMPYTNMVSRDFLEYDCREVYDRIIANPPFSSNQDINHIYKMWECLKPGGRLVTITSPHWTFASGRYEQIFRDWVMDMGGVTEDIGPGEFASSGTQIRTMILTLDK